LLATADLLHHEPFGESPRADSSRRFAGIVGIRWRSKEPWHRDTSHRFELAREPGLEDLFQIGRLRPGVEPSNDRRVPRQVDQRPRAVGRDDLTTADLALRLRLHPWSSTLTPLRSLRNRLTSGSTSRSERWARNLR